MPILAKLIKNSKDNYQRTADNSLQLLNRLKFQKEGEKFCQKKVL
jgi:hypothetical protein